MRRRPGRRRTRGQALVEFALIIPIFLLVVVGLFDMGRAVFAYNAVANAAREATRLAIVDQTVANIQAKAAKHSIGLGIAPGSVQVQFLNADLTTTAPCNATPVPVGCIAQVKVTYQYNAATPIIGNLVGTITINSTSRLPVERSFP